MNYEQFVSNIENFDSSYAKDITPTSYFGFPIEPLLEAEARLASSTEKSVAYFSMEYGLSQSVKRINFIAMRFFLIIGYRIMYLKSRLIRCSTFPFTVGAWVF
jgi:hypothetical protein